MKRVDDIRPLVMVAGDVFVAVREKVAAALSDGLIKLGIRPSDVLKKKWVLTTPEGWERIHNYYLEKLGVEVKTIPSKRLAMAMTPASPRKDVDHIQIAGLKLRIRILDKKLKSDGAGFFNSALAETLAVLTSGGISDPEFLNQRRREFLTRAWKFSSMFAKGILLPATETALQIVDPDIRTEIEKAFEEDVDIVIDPDMAKIRPYNLPADVEVEPGFDFFVHEIGDFWSGSIGIGQFFLRIIKLPWILGYKVNVATELLELYRDSLNTVFRAFIDDAVAARLLGNDNTDELFLIRMLKTVVPVEYQPAVMRNLATTAKKRIRKLRVGHSVYLVVSDQVPTGTALVNRHTARRLGLKNGKRALIQKYPILAGDSIIANMEIRKGLPDAVIVVSAEDTPAGWDSDGDKVLVLPTDMVFADENSTDEFVRFIRDIWKRINELMPDFGPALPQDELRVVEFGKRTIPMLDFRFSMDIVNGNLKDMDTAALATLEIQTVINMSNGKLPADKELLKRIWEEGNGKLKVNTDTLSDLGKLAIIRSQKFPMNPEDIAKIHPEFLGLKFNIPTVNEFPERNFSFLNLVYPFRDLKNDNVVELFLRTNRELSRLHLELNEEIRKLTDGLENIPREVAEQIEDIEVEYAEKSAEVRRNFKLELSKLNVDPRTVVGSVYHAAAKISPRKRNIFLGRIMSLVTVTPSVEGEFPTDYENIFFDLLNLAGIAANPDRFVGKRRLWEVVSDIHVLDVDKILSLLNIERKPGWNLKPITDEHVEILRKVFGMDTGISPDGDSRTWPGIRSGSGNGRAQTPPPSGPKYVYGKRRNEKERPSGNTENEKNVKTQPTPSPADLSNAVKWALTQKEVPIKPTVGKSGIHVAGQDPEGESICAAAVKSGAFSPSDFVWFWTVENGKRRWLAVLSRPAGQLLILDKEFSGTTVPDIEVRVGRLEKVDKRGRFWNDTVVVYTDGSYSSKSNLVGWGWITEDGTESNSGALKEEQHVKMRNVSGEIAAVADAIRHFKEKGFTHIVIRYDYAGIAKWITGEWKAKNDFVKRFLEWVRKQMTDIEIRFEKISGADNPADPIARKVTGGRNSHYGKK